MLCYFLTEWMLQNMVVKWNQLLIYNLMGNGIVWLKRVYHILFFMKLPLYTAAALNVLVSMVVLDLILFEYFE